MDEVKDVKLKNDFKEVDVEVLGLNSENYITFEWNNMWFLDSFKFQSAPLSKLVKNLGKEDMEMIIYLFGLNGLSRKQIEILCAKGVFPYIWFDEYGKMKWRSLPDRKYFQSDEEYEYAKKAWEILDCEAFEDYHDKYHSLMLYYLQVASMLLGRAFIKCINQTLHISLVSHGPLQ